MFFSMAFKAVQNSIPPHALKWRRLARACDHVGAVMLMPTTLEVAFGCHLVGLRRDIKVQGKQVRHGKLLSRGGSP